MYLFPESFTFLSSFFFVMQVINKCIIYLAFTTAGKTLRRISYFKFFGLVMTHPESFDVLTL